MPYTGCNPEDLPEAMNDREKWWETVKDIRAGGATWWWWWLRNHIEPKIDNILRKNQNGFRRNRSTTSHILTICRILEVVRAKNRQATLLFVDFTKAFHSIHRGKMEQILLAYVLPKETVAAITILYRNTKWKYVHQMETQNTSTL